MVSCLWSSLRMSPTDLRCRWNHQFLFPAHHLLRLHSAAVAPLWNTWRSCRDCGHFSVRILRSEIRQQDSHILNWHGCCHHRRRSDRRSSTFQQQGEIGGILPHAGQPNPFCLPSQPHLEQCSWLYQKDYSRGYVPDLLLRGKHHVSLVSYRFSCIR